MSGDYTWNTQLELLLACSHPNYYNLNINLIRSKSLLDRIIVYFNLTRDYQDADYYDIPILLCAEGCGYFSDRELSLYYYK